MNAMEVGLWEHATVRRCARDFVVVCADTHAYVHT
jgi:hypothetical protein